MVNSIILAASLIPGVVSTTEPNSAGLTLARQALPAVTAAKAKAESRTIYLNREGVVLTPGNNNAGKDVSSIVTEPTLISPWNTDDATWSQTVSCLKEIYAPFDVKITEVDPGSVPHIEAVFGGHPNDVGLPAEVAGVSPFTTNCSIIENSVVFTFTDVLPDDPRMICEVMAQEIAHSYGLDHEMLANDPMTYLDYSGERTFQNKMADCGEFSGRMCGIEGSVCRPQQNSFALLTERLGASGSSTGDDEDTGETMRPRGELDAGCSSTNGGFGLGLVLACAHLVVVARRRNGNRRPRALLQ